MDWLFSWSPPDLAFTPQQTGLSCPWPWLICAVDCRSFPRCLEPSSVFTRLIWPTLASSSKSASPSFTARTPASAHWRVIASLHWITKPLRYVSLMTTETIRILIFAAWMAPLLLFGIPAIFMYRDNPGFTMFVEISRVIIFQISPLVMFLIATCHLLRLALKSNRQTNALFAQVRFNHASGEINIQAPPQRTHARASTVLIVLIMTFFNVTYLGGNYRCICLLSDVCPFTGTLSYIIHLVLIANSAVNPIFYSFLKKDIRRELHCMFSS